MNIRSSTRTLAQDAVRVTAFAFNEIKEAGMNDPALAMRLTATTLTDQILTGVNGPIKDSFETMIVPVVRGGLLALNTYKANQTFKDPTSTLAEKTLDGLRVATDLVGLAGGVVALAFPQYKGTGDTMMGFAYAADMVSHAIRTISHGSQRITLWNKTLNEKSSAEPSTPADGDTKQGRTPATPEVPQRPEPPNAMPPKSASTQFAFPAPTSTALQYVTNMSTGTLAQVG